MDSVAAWKEAGNTAYSSGKYEEAISFYDRIADRNSGATLDQRLVALSNKSQGLLMLQKWQQSLDTTDEALLLFRPIPLAKPSNNPWRQDQMTIYLKVLYRKAYSLHKMGNESAAVQLGTIINDYRDKHSISTGLDLLGPLPKQIVQNTNISNSEVIEKPISSLVGGDLRYYVPGKWNKPDVILTGGAPRTRKAHSSVYYDDRIWIFGGEHSGLGLQPDMSKDMWTFHTKSLEWKKVVFNGATPSARYACSMVVYDDKFWLFGQGDNAYQMPARDLFWCLDPKTLQWSQIETTPYPRSRSVILPPIMQFHRAVVDKESQSMIVTGSRADMRSKEFGQNGATMVRDATDAIFLFDFPTRKWRMVEFTKIPAAKKPSFRENSGVWITGKYLYVFSGEAGYDENDLSLEAETMNDFWRLDLEAAGVRSKKPFDSKASPWERLPMIGNCPCYRHEMGLTPISNTKSIFMYGGYAFPLRSTAKTSTYLGDAFEWTPDENSDPGLGRWKMVDAVGTSPWHRAGTTVDCDERGRLFVVCGYSAGGGFQKGTDFNDVHVLELEHREELSKEEEGEKDVRKYTCGNCKKIFDRKLKRCGNRCLIWYCG
eukprot:TRINITY_DN17910_c0_g1_i1.p1 TRINITY_DN17910_c0_g1~~TRINITY_DN17910_c0_g1_i1.p1  ORF type:complete len:599 (-),score=74.52 TRINITY_DN17910_c0_g1_i1:34-1830(-)